MATIPNLVKTIVDRLETIAPPSTEPKAETMVGTKGRDYVFGFCAGAMVSKSRQWFPFRFDYGFSVDSDAPRVILRDRELNSSVQPLGVAL